MHQCSIKIDVVLFQIVQIGFCLSHDVNVFRRKRETLTFRYIQWFSKHNEVAKSNSPDILQTSALAFIASRLRSKSRALPTAKGTSRLAQSRGFTPWSRSFQPSGGVNVDVVSDVLA